MTNRYSLACVIAAALAACGSRPAPSAATTTTPVGNTGGDTTPAPSIAGSYNVPHSIDVVCDNEDGYCEEEAEDTMTVKDGADGAVDVVIELVQTNDHTCSFEGTLKPDASAPADAPSWVFDDQSEEEGPCTLTLTATATELQISSSGCRYYCGVRASLDASFPR